MFRFDSFPRYLKAIKKNSPKKQMRIHLTRVCIGIIIYGWVSTLSASNLYESESPLFAKVINVDQDDMLNIRKEPDYRAGKVGEAFPSSIVGVNVCQTNHNSTWCKITVLASFDEVETGWVNARFLDLEGKHANRGYVKMVGRPNSCYYSIKCEEREAGQMCMIANSSFSDPASRNASKASTEWVRRDQLIAGSAFDSAPDNYDGYCINGMIIDDYYK